MNTHSAKGDGTSRRFWSWRARRLSRPLPNVQMRGGSKPVLSGAAGGAASGKKGRATGSRLRLRRGDGRVAHGGSRLTGSDGVGSGRRPQAPQAAATGGRRRPPPPAGRACCLPALVRRPGSSRRHARPSSLAVYITVPHAYSTRSGVQFVSAGNGAPTWPFTWKQMTSPRVGVRQ